jgi:hypothetical protein
MSPHSEASTQEVLAGLVERVTYHNAENGFCVLRARARGHRDVVTVVGHAASISAGEWITASGDWVNDRTHGQQFKARLARRPADRRMQRLGQKQAGISTTKEQPSARPQNVVNLTRFGGAFKRRSACPPRRRRDGNGWKDPVDVSPARLPVACAAKTVE